MQLSSGHLTHVSSVRIICLPQSLHGPILSFLARLKTPQPLLDARSVDAFLEPHFGRRLHFEQLSSPHPPPHEEQLPCPQYAKSSLPDLSSQFVVAHSLAIFKNPRFGQSLTHNSPLFGRFFGEVCLNNCQYAHLLIRSKFFGFFKVCAYIS